MWKIRMRENNMHRGACGQKAQSQDDGAWNREMTRKERQQRKRRTTR
jgi:hypothetical protein